jgi:putative copper export protein
VLALAALGGWARRRLLPAVAARRPVGVAGWIGVELAVMGAVLGLAAVLAGSAPPT